MRSSIVLSLAALVGIAAALPQPPIPAPTDIFTPESKDDGFNLTRRGEYCAECPPEDYRYKGCLYIECSDDCEDEDCCSCIGLHEKKPYVSLSLDMCD
jgi:hypothetical protein